MSRNKIKGLGGQIIARRRYAEITEELWQTPDRRYWRGDDWYNDNIAMVHEVSGEAAAAFIANVRDAYLQQS